MEFMDLDFVKTTLHPTVYKVFGFLETFLNEL